MRQGVPALLGTALLTAFAAQAIGEDKAGVWHELDDAQHIVTPDGETATVAPYDAGAHAIKIIDPDVVICPEAEPAWMVVVRRGGDSSEVVRGTVIDDGSGC